MDEKVKDTNDKPVLGHIERLVAEEHKLYNQGALAEEDRLRLTSIQVELDQDAESLPPRVRVSRGGAGGSAERLAIIRRASLGRCRYRGCREERSTAPVARAE
jgi:Protein of unknown function (DUF2630)